MKIQWLLRDLKKKRNKTIVKIKEMIPNFKHYVTSCGSDKQPDFSNRRTTLSKQKDEYHKTHRSPMFCILQVMFTRYIDFSLQSIIKRES